MSASEPLKRGALAVRPRTELELLRAAAHAAVDAGNWTLLRALEPLIDTETKRAAARTPVNLQAVRASRRQPGKSER